jgi:hypothetical protein
LKTAFPEEDFPLNPNILMVSILKINLEVNNSNLADSYNISLSTADCLRNFEHDLANIYLPSLGESNENMRGLMTSLRKTLGPDDELVLLPGYSLWSKTMPLWTPPMMNSTTGNACRRMPLVLTARKGLSTSKTATRMSRKDGMSFQTYK